MAKPKTLFFCKECGCETPNWYGQCPSCKAWNSIVEAPGGLLKPVDKASLTSGTAFSGIRAVKPAYISEIELIEADRYTTGMPEFDRVLGGGIVGGSLVLLGGDPGIGKSTILLQMCINLAKSGRRVLYISGEESLKQIKLRATRLADIQGELKFLCETNLDTVSYVIDDEKPEIVIIDSIQTMFKEELAASPGSVSQVRESTNVLMNIAKSNNIAIFIIGHVTKEGQVAGPRVLEHMVDTVLYFEGERQISYRILRAVKNRFGSTNEIGVFEMGDVGLTEVENPSEYMLSGKPEKASGTSVACLIEGTRPILVEVQALVTKTAFGMPRRTAAGADFNRLNLLLAVIEKRCRFNMSAYDAYINIAGGMKFGEPALDLSIVLSLISSLKDKSIDDKTVIFGEVGLLGEVRAVNLPEYRIKEARKLGFDTCILPKINLDKIKYKGEMKLVGVSNIRQAMEYLI